MSWVAFALVVIGTAVKINEDNKTARRQDNEAAAGIQRQGRLQAKADEKVNAEVEQLKNSTAQTARREALDSYSRALQAGERSTTIGLPGGGEAFQKAANDANGAVRQYGATNANLMATMEGAGTQRLREGFSYGRLGTDLSLIGRQSAGDEFINNLKTRAIRNNPWVDGAAGVMVGAGGAMGGGGTGAGQKQQAPSQTTSKPAPPKYGYGG